MSKVISMVGLADKRPLIYGLCHCLGKVGKTIVLTANESFLGASEYKETNFSIHDVQFLVTTREGEDAFMEAAWRPFEYDFVIHDCPLMIPPETDIVVHVGSQNRRMWILEREMIDNFPELPKVTICVGGGKYSPIKSLDVMPEEETIKQNAVYKKSFLPFLKPKLVTHGVVADKPKDEESLLTMRITSGMWGYVNQLEDMQTFPPLQDSELLNIVSIVAAKVANLDAKLVKKQLQRGKV